MNKNVYILIAMLLGIIDVQAQWISINNIPSAPTDGACSFFIDDNLYVGGGAGSNSFYMLDIETEVWVQKANIPGNVARGWAIGFSIDGKGYIGGGDVGGFSLRSDFYRYDPEFDTWTQIADFGGGVRDGAYSCTYDGKAYVIGGFDGSFALGEVWEYEPTLDQWTQKNNYPGGQTIFPAGFILNDRIYVGTGSSDGFANKSDFYEYDPGTDTWIQKSDLPGVAKQACVGFAVENMGYIGGGQENYSNILPDFYSYDVNTDTWQIEPNLAFSDQDAVAWSTAAVYGNTVYMGTGADFNNSTLNFSDEFYKITLNSVGLEETHQKSFEILSNPVEEVLQLSGEYLDAFDQVSIQNIEGRLIYASDKVDEMISVEDLSPGMYIIHLSNHTSGFKAEKMFIKRK